MNWFGWIGLAASIFALWVASIARFSVEGMAFTLLLALASGGFFIGWLVFA